MQVTKGTWCMCEQCIQALFPPLLHESLRVKLTQALNNICHEFNLSIYLSFSFAYYLLPRMCPCELYANSPGGFGTAGAVGGSRGRCWLPETAATAAEIVCWLTAVCTSLNSAAITSFPVVPGVLSFRLTIS